MGAPLDNAPLVHHADEVGVAYGGQAVGDDDGGAVLHQIFQCLLYQFFRFGV